MRSVVRNATVPSGGGQGVDAYKLLREAMINAKYVCDQDEVDELECAVAWDTVDEIGRGISKIEERDPLEMYCMEHEEDDECRVYDV